MNNFDDYIFNLFIQAEQYKIMMTFSKNSYQRNLNKKLLKNTLNIIDIFTNLYRQQEFTIEELSNFDGSNGKPAYVAINGIVYDVSNVPAWGGGTHFGLIAGKDFSNEFTSCHANSKNILSNLTVVGKLKI